jgi:hypothetical protein
MYRNRKRCARARFRRASVGRISSGQDSNRVEWPLLGLLVDANAFIPETIATRGREHLTLSVETELL